MQLPFMGEKRADLMIINTGQRTDIPAFYSRWFLNRLKEGYVLVRNPYNMNQVTRYRLSPDVVDLIGFCTKEPGPMLPHLDALKEYGQYWFVTITPYGRDIEPGVPEKEKVLQEFRELSKAVGRERVAWRYDPIFLDEIYTTGRHLECFEKMASFLSGYTQACVISFIDLYAKVRKNFPQARSVSKEDRLFLGKEMVRIGEKYGMVIKPCAEGQELAAFGADCSGCATIRTYEKALGCHLSVPLFQSSRKECACYLSCDIGAYDTCGHLCHYCYANEDVQAVKRRMKMHDPDSPFLIGGPLPGDVIHEAKQESWKDPQMSIFDFI